MPHSQFEKYVIFLAFKLAPPKQNQLCYNRQKYDLCV